VTTKEELVQIWHHSDELCQDLEGLSDEDIISLRETMLERCQNIRLRAGIHLTDEDLKEV
jgi:hypothetical protein